MIRLIDLENDIVRRKALLEAEPYSQSYAEQEVRELVDASLELCSDEQAPESQEARKLIVEFEKWTHEHAKTSKKV